MSKRILIAEDNDFNLRVVELVLRAHGYETIAALDGQQAVELAKKEKPDLVLMDLQMPTMDGITATKIIKGDEETHDIPVVALTAHAMEDDERKALAAGCDGYITKPVDTRLLPRQLESFMKSK